MRSLRMSLNDLPIQVMPVQLCGFSMPFVDGGLSESIDTNGRGWPRFVAKSDVGQLPQLELPQLPDDLPRANARMRVTRK